MYTPKLHEETDAATMQALIAAHPLGTWVVHGDDGLEANHIPFLFDPDGCEHGRLLAHVARANDVWKLCQGEVDSMVIFQGHDGYISPSWYPSKHTEGKAVPTWNYAVVHAHGQPRVIEDPQRLLDLLTRMTQVHEAGQALPWKVSDAPDDYIQRMLTAIVGIEIPITKLVGKWKVSQNRTVPDKLGVVAGLLGRADDKSQAMAAMISRYGKLGVP